MYGFTPRRELPYQVPQVLVVQRHRILGRVAQVLTQTLVLDHLWGTSDTCGAASLNSAFANKREPATAEESFMMTARSVCVRVSAAQSDTHLVDNTEQSPLHHHLMAPAHHIHVSQRPPAHLTLVSVKEV
jgi:hypothetical protein